MYDLDQNAAQHEAANLRLKKDVPELMRIVYCQRDASGSRGVPLVSSR